MFRSLCNAQQRRHVLSDGGQGPVVVYATDWCAATQMVWRYLDRVGVPYVYRNMERDPNATAQVKWWNGGYASHPTVQIGGQILVEPSAEELRSALSQEGLV